MSVEQWRSSCRTRPVGFGDVDAERRGRWFWVPRIVVAVLVVLIGLGGVAQAAQRQEKRKTKDLPERWRVWIEEEVYVLIDREQTDAFLALETEAQREAYVERLWQLWARQSGYGSEYRRIYEDRLQFCRSEFETTTSDRARVLLIHGVPEGRQKFECIDIVYPIDVWVYGHIPGFGENVVILFYKPFATGTYRLWNPLLTRQELYTFHGWSEATRSVSSRWERVEMRCQYGEEMLNYIAAAEAQLKDPKLYAALRHMPRIEQHGPESPSRRFMEFSALLDDRAKPLDFTVAQAPRKIEGAKVVMGLNVRVPTQELGSGVVGDVDITQVDIIGEISRSESMIDRFRYLFTVPTGGDNLALLLERSLRPGTYNLRLKVEDVHSRHAGIKEIPLEVRPPTAEELAAAQKKWEDTEKRKVEERAISSRYLPEGPLLLMGPEDHGVSGVQRFEAFTNPQVARVSFLVNDRLVLSKNRPPFDVELDLGPLPRLITVTAIAYDKKNRELDRQDLSLNIGSERFFLRIQPFAPGDRLGDKLFVKVTMNTPSDIGLDRLELYWNDLLLAKLFQEPFEAWIDIGTSQEEFGYLRAVAVLEDGSQAEDIQFINAPRFGDAIEVTAVELPVSVLDRSQKPVEDLTIDNFTVLENDVEQVLSHCSIHRDLPVRLGLVIDTSGSMEKTLPEVQRVVMGFLRDFVRPRDRAFIEVFSDIPEILAPFTADFETLENALLALFPDRKTALNDAIILGLFEFSGVRGRRAMVVLTDGADTGSQHTFDEVIDYAQRSGVTIYTIGINIGTSEVLTRYQLKTLASVTGGRSFFLELGAKLDSVYEAINRELRTQYLLAYTSSSESGPDELREIEVKVDRRGVTVRTRAGYYPVSF